MKIIPPLIVIFLLFTQYSVAEIYKTTDNQGNVTYTDSPSPDKDTRKIKLPPVITIPVAPFGYPNSSTRNTPEDQPEQYKILEIIQPENNSTVRDNGNFTVKVKLSPRLKRTDKIRLKLNGKEYRKPDRSLIIPLKNIDRGTQILEVSVIDHDGETIMSTTSTVHVQRTVFKPAP